MRAIVLLLLFLLSLAACGKQADAPVQKQQGPLQWKATYSSAECTAFTERDAFVQRCFGGKFADKNYVGGEH